jgi:hypothetical protein
MLHLLFSTELRSANSRSNALNAGQSGTMNAIFIFTFFLSLTSTLSQGNARTKGRNEMFSGALKKRSRTVCSQSCVSAMKAEALTLGAQND